MAVRPVFVPEYSASVLVSEVLVEFTWFPGMSSSQKRKSINSLHESAKRIGISPILEISTKSEMEIGRRLSGFNLTGCFSENENMYLECAYQGSKVFRMGGPFTDLYNASPRDAKRDPRLINSGDLIAFEFAGRRFPLSPKNAFYDWLYINCLHRHKRWILKNVRFEGFTDIEYNPKKSVNCQARAFAEFLALCKRGDEEKAVKNFSYFAEQLITI